MRLIPLFRSSATAAPLLFLLTLTLIDRADAKRLFIATTGNDAVTYAENSQAKPWKSVSKAFSEPKAGDTACFMPGEYSITAHIDQRSMGSHGTQTKRIIITSCTSDEALIVGSSSLDPVIDIEKDFHTVQNLRFQGPGRFFRVGYDFTGTSAWFINLKIKMVKGGDNFGFIYIDGAVDPHMERCVVEGVYPSGSGTPNFSCGIIVFRGSGAKILRNEFHHMATGVYYKHANTPVSPSNIEIAYNYIHHTDRFSMQLNCNYASVHDNLMGASNAQFFINDANGVAGGDFNVFDHNTLYDCPLILQYQTEGGDPNPGAIKNTFRNNIFLKGAEFHRYSAVPHASIAENNLYAPGSVIWENRITYTLAAWKTKSAQEKNSFEGSPIYPVAASLLSATGIVPNFRLTSASPGYRKGTDGKDIGADVGAVGPGVSTPINLDPSLYRSIAK
ncbi:MAG: hypothetical protein ABIW76_06715 [Fibrobacteria bacterium]